MPPKSNEVAVQWPVSPVLDFPTSPSWARPPHKSRAREGWNREGFGHPPGVQAKAFTVDPDFPPRELLRRECEAAVRWFAQYFDGRDN